MAPEAQVDEGSKDKDKDNETDKEQGSLNTTLTGTTNRTPFYRRRANKSSTSEGALSSSTSPSIVKPSPLRTRSKPSFLSRIVHKVMPCVGPTPSTPRSYLDDAASGTSEPKQSVALRERTGARESEIDTKDASSDNQGSTNAEPSRSATLTIPPITIYPPPSPTDSEVIIPPPPSSHLLPEDETDGVTSGAVQPPGSTGDQIARSHSRASSAESDCTNVTDDEGDDPHPPDEQAEEERLIRNGGSGVPIGPVCVFVVLDNECFVLTGISRC